MHSGKLRVFECFKIEIWGTIICFIDGELFFIICSWQGLVLLIVIPPALSVINNTLSVAPFVEFHGTCALWHMCFYFLDKGSSCCSKHAAANVHVTIHLVCLIGFKDLCQKFSNPIYFPLQIQLKCQLWWEN